MFKRATLKSRKKPVAVVISRGCMRFVLVLAVLALGLLFGCAYVKTHATVGCWHMAAFGTDISRLVISGDGTFTGSAMSLEYSGRWTAIDDKTIQLTYYDPIIQRTANMKIVYDEPSDTVIYPPNTRLYKCA